MVKNVIKIIFCLDISGGILDGCFIVLMGVEVVEFGFFNVIIYKVNECVNVDDLSKCGEVYY